MQIVTKVLNHFDGETQDITMASNGRIANKLKTTKDNFKSFGTCGYYFYGWICFFDCFGNFITVDSVKYIQPITRSKI